MEYIKSFFKIIFTPPWWKDFCQDENDDDDKVPDEEGGNYIVEECIDDETYNTIYKENNDICIEELENFLKTMKICEKNENNNEYLFDDIFEESDEDSSIGYDDCVD